MPNVNTPLPEYENIFGTKKVMVVDHLGPASYQAGGETINAADFGWGGIDACIPLGFSPTGIYGTIPKSAVGCVRSLSLLWYDATSIQGFQTEVADNTNLSAQSVKLLLIGV